MESKQNNLSYIEDIRKISQNNFINFYIKFKAKIFGLINESANKGHTILNYNFNLDEVEYISNNLTFIPKILNELRMLGFNVNYLTTPRLKLTIDWTQDIGICEEK